MPLADGQELAGYTIVRSLGAGGMGEVYLAQHPRLPRYDALKVLSATVCADNLALGTAATTSQRWKRLPQTSRRPRAPDAPKQPEQQHAHAGPRNRVEPCLLASSPSQHLESHRDQIGNPNPIQKRPITL